MGIWKEEIEENLLDKEQYLKNEEKKVL